LCGLVGVAGDLTHKEVEAFKDLLYISTFRGWDSTGVAVVSCRGEHDDASYSIAKCLGPAFNLLDSKQLDRALNNTFKKALIGHTRHATVGDSGKVTNAHPFGFKNIVGAHNGTLDYNTRRDIKDFKYFGTDSEALLYSIEEEGVKKTIESQEGAWALTYADMDKKTLHFLRNDQRPLAFCYNKNRDALYWASEPGFLRFVLARKDIEIFEKTVWWCPENLLYSFDLPMKPFGKFEKPKAEKIEGKQKVTHYSSNNNNSSPFAAAADKLFRGRQQGGNANKSASVQKEPSRVIKLMSKHNLSSAEDSDDNCSISLLA
jgi:asparagine synthetase B (glutamine-hydrolysing)